LCSIPNPALAVCEALIRFSKWCARQMHRANRYQQKRE
jgi:hypothetical protein